jgi:hypothetical protein
MARRIAQTWIDGYELSVGDIGFLVEVCPEQRADYCVLQDRPAYTNQSHEPRLYGWCGTTNNVARFGQGVARVIRCAKNGRACVQALEGAELTAALEELGFPELDPAD